MKKPSILDQLRYQVEREDELDLLLNHLRGLDHLACGLVQTYGQLREEEGEESDGTFTEQDWGMEPEQPSLRQLDAVQWLARQGALLHGSIIGTLTSLVGSSEPVLLSRLGQGLEGLRRMVESTSLVVAAAQTSDASLFPLQLESAPVWTPSLVSAAAPVEAQLVSYAAALSNSAAFYLDETNGGPQTPLNDRERQRIAELEEELAKANARIRQYEEERETWKAAQYPVLTEYDAVFFAGRTGLSSYYIRERIKDYQRNSQHPRFQYKRRTKKVFTPNPRDAEQFEKWLCEKSKCPKK